MCSASATRSLIRGAESNKASASASASHLRWVLTQAAVLPRGGEHHFERHKSTVVHDPSQRARADDVRPHHHPPRRRRKLPRSTRPTHTLCAVLY
eukprot:1329594-Rhodomonas_salina.1